MEFSNREIAIGVWMAVAMVWLLYRQAVRASFARLVRSAFHIKIAVPMIAMVIYAIIVVTILAGIGVWSSVLLKDTVYWFLGVGLLLFARMADSNAPLQDWKKVVMEQIGVLVVLTFIMNSYTFSLPVELVLVPIAVLIAMIGALAEMKEEYPDVARLFGGLQALFGWFVLLAAVGKAIQDYTALASLQSFQKLSFPFLMTSLTLPFMYLLFLYVKYDYVFVWSAFKHPRELTCYMRRRALIYGGLRPARVNRLSAIPPYEFMRVKSREEFDALIARIDQAGEAASEDRDNRHNA